MTNNATRQEPPVSNPDRDAPAERADSPHENAASAGTECGPILFFDGVCGLCNGIVNWLMSRDSKEILRYAPLQGETAAKMLSPAETESLNSVILKDKSGLHRRSSAAVRTLGHLGGRYRIYAKLLWLIPAPLRELGYKIISKTRYYFFGKRESCRMPTPEERGRLLP